MSYNLDKSSPFDIPICIYGVFSFISLMIFGDDKIFDETPLWVYGSIVGVIIGIYYIGININYIVVKFNKWLDK